MLQETQRKWTLNSWVLKNELRIATEAIVAFNAYNLGVCQERLTDRVQGPERPNN